MLAAARSGLAERSKRNAEVLAAMGMAGRMRRLWSKANAGYMARQLASSDAASGLGAISKSFRLMLQSAVLGLGGYLVIRQEATAGVIIASSILTARARKRRGRAGNGWRSFST